MSFLPCPQCHRHVRATESACVFCGTSLAARTFALSPVALVSMAALGLVACEPKAEPPVQPTTVDVPAPSALTAPSAAAPSAVPSAPTAVSSTSPAVSPSAPASAVQATPIRPAMRYGIAPNRKQ